MSIRKTALLDYFSYLLIALLILSIFSDKVSKGVFMTLFLLIMALLFIKSYLKDKGGFNDS